MVALVRAVPAALVAVAASLLAWETTGSIRAADWAPYAIGITLVLSVVLLAGAAVVPGRLQLAASLLLAGFAVWTAISATWSSNPQLARNDGFLALVYAVAFLTPLLTLRDRAERLAASVATVAALTVLTLATAYWLRGHGDPELLYFDGRLDFPVTYWNGQAAMALIGFWPALALSASREAHLLVRAPALGGATGMLALWLGTQSKGGGVALVVSAVAVLALTPQRLRLVVPGALAATVALGLGAVALTEPFRTDGEAFAEAVRHAGTVTLAIVVVGTLAGLVYALVDRRIVVPSGLRRWLGRGALAAVIALAIAGVALFFARVEHPIRAAEHRWDDFRHIERNESSSHFSQLGSNRYDFWRVAWNEFEGHPIAGIGGFGWGDAYLIHRNSLETPQRSHSVEMDALSETGLLGFLLVVAAGVAALVAVGLRARRSLTATGAFGAGVYFMIHTGGDWVWTIPSVGILAMLVVGIGASDDGRPPLPRRAGIPAGAVLVAIAAFALAPPWLSSRLVERAYDSGSAAAAASDLRWARRLDPLAVEPLVAQAALADPPANIPPLERAVDRKPRNSEIHYLLGLAYLDAGRKASARDQLRIAVELSPKDEALRRALADAGG